MPGKEKAFSRVVRFLTAGAVGAMTVIAAWIPVHAKDTEKISVFVLRASPAVVVKYKKSLGRILCTPTTPASGVVNLLETRLSPQDQTKYQVDFDVAKTSFIIKTVSGGKEVIIGSTSDRGTGVDVPGNDVLYFSSLLKNNPSMNRFRISKGKLEATTHSVLYEGYERAESKIAFDLYAEKSASSAVQKIPEGTGFTVIETDPASEKTLEQWYRIMTSEGVTGWIVVRLSK